MLATSSISIINVDDGNGVVSVDITYAIGSSPTTPPGNPLTDDGVIITDINGLPLTDASWQITIPDVPQGSYLWTRTITTYTSGDFSIAYVVGYSGTNGQNGASGVSISTEKEQWYLSDSSSSLTGGSWSYTEPDPSYVQNNKYLWGRWEFTMSDGTTQYSDAVCRQVVGGAISLAYEADRKILQKVWETDIDSKISEFDNSTTSVIHSRLAQTETNLSGITSTVSDHTSQIANNTSNITSATTIANQAADHIGWMIDVDGKTSSTFTFKSRIMELVNASLVIKDPAGSQTIITGGKITANSITTNMLASNAIKSTNYSSGTSGSDIPAYNASSNPYHYSTTGTFMDLSTGNIYSPNFSLINTPPSSPSASVGAYFNGTIRANSGQIGDPGNAYWSIGTVNDTSWGDYAGLIANGNALIQSGQLTLSSNRLNSQNAGSYIHSGNYWYDFGLQVPDMTAVADDHDENFLYIRRIGTQPSSSTLDSAWSYLFRVDKNGNIYWNGHDISDGTFLPLSGGIITGSLTVTGTITGTVTQAQKLTPGKTIQTNLASTSSATFTGENNITPGVTGTLGVGNGGTGKASWTANGIVYASASNALAQMAVGTSGQVLTSGGNAAPAWTSQSELSVGTATKATQDANGDVIATTYRKVSNNTFNTITVTDLSAANLVVTGSATFTNGLSGSLTGNATTATTATQVANNLKIQLNGGTTEGTNQFTYNGSAVKNINITKSSIGLGNVENTALSTWTGSSNLTTTSVGTLAGAATKAVDNSISAESSSTNLPTSAAVATFVEGKGYVTSSGVTSVRVQATSPVVSSTNTEQTSTLNTTISLANGYGDTKNPYGTKTANYVLAGPSSGSAAAPTFRALVAADIPSITISKISDFPTTWALTNITGADDLKAIEGLTGTSGILKKTAANTWALTTVVSGVSINNDVLTISKSDGTSTDFTINITGQVVSGATILSDAQGNPISSGSASAPVYFSNGVPAQANTIPTIALNGSSTTAASFYAPTGAGTSGQYLKSSGSGAPSWETFSKSTVGLGNVDNTSDLNKPISTATQTALDTKAHKNNGIYVVKGTQTASTESWTGNIDIPTLYDGLTIAYYLPYAGTSTSATLTLTLSDNTTTAAVPVYYTASTRVTTHYGAGSTIILTYWSAGSISVAGTATETARWTRGDYSVSNTNTIGEYAGGLKAGPNGMARYSLVMQVSSELWESVVLTSSTTANKARNTSGFLINSPIYYQNGGTYTSGNTCTYTSVWCTYNGLDSRYSCNTNTTWSTGAKPFYFVGTISKDPTDGLWKFYLRETTWWADELPATADGYYYWTIGRTHDKYKYVLLPNHPIYYVDSNGVVREFSPYQNVNGYSIESSVPVNALFTDTPSDWNETDSTSLAYIANKPTIGTSITLTGDATGSATLNSNGSWSIATTVGHATAADSATSATKDGSNNTITSYYTTLSTTQTISGAKTFSAATSFTNTTASTSKSTGAVLVSGGVGVAGRMSANEVGIADHVVLQYNVTTQSLDFIFN